MESSPPTPKSAQALKPKARENGAHEAAELVQQAQAEGETVLKSLGSSANGLSAAEVQACARKFGPNAIAREKKLSIGRRLLDNVKNPLVVLLSALGVISFITGDIRATVVIFIMVLLGIV